MITIVILVILIIFLIIIVAAPTKSKTVPAPNTSNILSYIFFTSTSTIKSVIKMATTAGDSHLHSFISTNIDINK